jgi:hypothetical protein
MNHESFRRVDALRVRIYIYIRETDGCDRDRDRCACIASSAAKGRVLGGLEEFIDAEQPSREETPSALEVRFYVARACVRASRVSHRRWIDVERARMSCTCE